MLISPNFTTLVANAILHELEQDLGTCLHVIGCPRSSDGLPYEKPSDGKGVARCIAGEMPFELPSGWAWTRVCSLVSKLGSGSTPRGGQRVYVEYGIPLIRSQNVYNDGLRLEDVAYIDEATNKSKSGSIVYGLDLLLNITGGSIGRCAIVPSDFPGANVNQHVMIIRLIEPSLCRFVHAFVTSPFTQALIFGKQLGSGRGGLSAETFSSFLVPVPPLAEQRRIVDALDKYLALVDGIERDRADLDGLLAQLKSKVLDLAVRGELVEHNPGDEPASELLARIHAEKLAMLERGELKPKDVKNDTVIFAGSDGLRYEKPADGKGEAKCIEKEIPFEVPEGWSWARLGVISNYGDASGVPIESIKNDAWIVDLEDIEKDTGRILAKLKKGERDSSSSKRPFKSGQILYSKLRPYLNKVLIADEDGFCTSEIMPIALYDNMAPDYIRRCLMSPYFLAYANQCAYGCKMPRLSTSDGKKALISIPPLVEQHRIVEAIEAAFDITNL